MIFRTLATNAGGNALGLLNAVLLSRWLGPSGRGEIAAAFLWPSLLIYLGSMGLIVSTMYFSSLPDSRPRIVLNNAIVLGLLLSAPAVAGGFLAMPWLLHSQPPPVIWASRLYLAVIPTSLVNQFGIAVLQGQQRIRAMNWLNTIIPFGYFLGTLVLIAAGKLTLTNVVVLHLGLNCLALSVALAVLWRGGVSPGMTTDLTLARRMLAYGAKLHIGQISGFANLNLDQTLIAAWLPPFSLGLYVVAVSSASVSQIFAGAVQTVAMPAIARENNPHLRRQIFERIFGRFWFGSLLIIICMAAALPLLLPFVYGPAFRLAIIPAEILLLGSLFMGAKGLLAGGAMALGDPWLTSKANLFALPVTLACLSLLLPILGLNGAAIASTLAYFTEFAVVLFGLRRRHEISPLRLVSIRHVRLSRLAGLVRPNKRQPAAVDLKIS